MALVRSSGKPKPKRRRTDDEVVDDPALADATPDANESVSAAGAEGSDDTPAWRAKGLAKKQRKREARLATQQPAVEWPPQAARPSHIKIADLRDLALSVLADGMTVKFVMLRHPQHLAHVVFVMASGLAPTLVRAHQDCLSNLLSIAGEPALALAPGDKGRIFSSLHALLQCPLPKEIKTQRAAAAAAAAATATTAAAATMATAPPAHPGASSPALLPSALLVDLAQMRENNYPVQPDGSALEGYVELHRPPTDASAPGPLFGIDCEMVGTRRARRRRCGARPRTRG